MYFLLTWYGLSLACEQTPGENMVWHDVRPSEAQDFADSETYERLKYLEGRGYDLPNWTIEWVAKYERHNRG